MPWAETKNNSKPVDKDKAEGAQTRTRNPFVTFLLYLFAFFLAACASFVAIVFVAVLTDRLPISLPVFVLVPIRTFIIFAVIVGVLNFFKSLNKLNYMSTLWFLGGLVVFVDLVSVWNEAREAHEVMPEDAKSSLLIYGLMLVTCYVVFNLAFRHYYKRRSPDNARKSKDEGVDVRSEDLKKPEKKWTLSPDKKSEWHQVRPISETAQLILVIFGSILAAASFLYPLYEPIALLNLDSRRVGYLFGKIIGHAFILWAAGFLWAVFRYLLARVMKRPVRFYSALLNGTTMVTALALLVSVSFVDIAAEDVGLIVSLWTLCFGMAGAYLSAYLFVKTVVSESPRKINFLLAGLGLILGIISGISALIWLNIPIHYLIGSKNIPTSNATMALAAGFSGFLYGIPFSIWGVRKGWVKAKNRSEVPSGEESSNDTRERGEGETSDRPKQKGLSGKRLIAALSILFLPLIAVWIYGISSGVNDVSSSKSSNLIWCATKSSAFETTEKFCTRGQPDAQIFPTEAEAQAAHRRLKSLSSRVATTSSKSDVEVVSVGAHQLSIPPPEGFCVLRSDNLYERQLIEATAEASDPPPLNWSTPIVRKRRIRYGNQETQTRRDCNEAKAG